MTDPKRASMLCSRCGKKFVPPGDCKCFNMCPECEKSPYKRFPISEATGGQ